MAPRLRPIATAIRKTGSAGKVAAYYYPNTRTPPCSGITTTRWASIGLTYIAGLFGAYIIRDAVEDALNLPAGKYEIPLVIYDRMFEPDGQLDYPVSAIPTRPGYPSSSATRCWSTANCFPYLEVEPRKYRFRILNGINGTFLPFIAFQRAAVSSDRHRSGALPAPVPLKQLLLAPAERADLVVDFADHAGEQIVLENDVFFR